MTGFVNPNEMANAGMPMGMSDPLSMMGQRTSALLLVYTPRIYDAQVLRPFVYNFGEQAVNKLLGAADTMTQAMDRADIANSEPIAQSIAPDPNGTLIDMNTFNQLWTFTLVIKQPNTYNGVAVQNLGYKTTIMTGHCLQEPVNPLTMGCDTPVFNLACPLVVHTRQVVTSGMQSIDAYGARNNTHVMCSDNVVDPSLQAAAPGSDLYLLTPYTVLSNYDWSGTEGSVTSTPGVVAIQNLDRSPIQTALKTPGVHMRQILQGLDCETREAQSTEYAPKGLSAFGAMTGMDNVDAFKEGLINKYSQLAVGSDIQVDGLSANSIFTIGDIVRTHPDVVMQPVRVSPTAQKSIMPQSIMSPKIQYSSMIQASVPALAADVGLSSIAFMYTTYDPAKRNDLIKSSYQVVPSITFLSAPPTDPGLRDFTLKSAVEMFFQLFEKNVVPFIKPVVGNFEVTAKYLANGECEVNLQLLDFNANVNGGPDAWTETPMRLGTLSMTSLGSESVFNNNGQNMSELMLLTQGKTQWNPDIGAPAFPMPENIGQAPVGVVNYAGMQF